MTRILVIDDEEASCRTLKLHFKERGFDVETAGSAEEGFDLINSHDFDLVISDIRMPGRDGLSLLREMNIAKPDLPFIMITAFQDLDSTVAAMRGGAVDYVAKPIDLEELENAVDKAVRRQDDEAGDDIVLSSDSKYDVVVGRSGAMQEVFKQIGIASQNRVNILIDGEPGTGKEAVARAIHKAGEDYDKPFAAISCSSQVETFLESELFGHVQGGFSGAEGERTGKVELAGEGTLFLGEVNELSPHLQGKLLRLLEDNEFTPMGAMRPTHAACRFILAADADLRKEVNAGRFREDLYYRLGVFSITVPPLRQRAGDIPLLVERLVNKINKEANKTIRRVLSDCMEALVKYDWPGNVRQLENVLTKAVVVAPGDSLSLSLLPEVFISGKRLPATDQETGEGKTLKELEREHIYAVLVETGWHKGKACDILGISRPRLDRRIDEFGFVREE